MFPLIFQSLCAHKISFVQHFTTTHCIWNIAICALCKNIFWRDIYVHYKFSCVCSSYSLCARAQAHSLEGTLVLRQKLKKHNILNRVLLLWLPAGLQLNSAVSQINRFGVFQQLCLYQARQCRWSWMVAVSAKGSSTKSTSVVQLTWLKSNDLTKVIFTRWKSIQHESVPAGASIWFENGGVVGPDLKTGGSERS